MYNVINTNDQNETNQYLYKETTEKVDNSNFAYNNNDQLSIGDTVEFNLNTNKQEIINGGNDKVFNRLRNLQILLKKESALKELFIKTSSATKQNIEEQCRKIYKKKLDVFLTLRKFNSKHKNEKLVNKFELIEQNNENLKDLNNYIPKLLTYLWEDPKIMSNLLLNSNIKDIKKIIGPLLANNFYENILSFNYLQENFMFVLTLLCKEEISNLSSSNDINLFLQDTPCGCLLEQLINKIDIKSYFNRILKDVIENIEIKCSERKMNFLINIIEEQIKDRKKKKIKKMKKRMMFIGKILQKI